MTASGTITFVQATLLWAGFGLALCGVGYLFERKR